MKRNTLNKLLLIAIVCLAFGCKAHKQVLATRAAAPAKVVHAVNPLLAKLATIRESQVNFNTFSGKAKAKLDIDGKSNDVTLNIRIQKNQRIWVSITYLLGVEVARALITPDSILVVNRLQGVYLKKPFSYVHNYAGQQVNYKTIESLLIGNAVPELVSDTSARLQAGANGSTTLSGNIQGLIYNLVLGGDYKVTQTSLANHGAGQSLQVSNSAFVQAGNKVVPSQINIQSTVKNNHIEANLHYSRTEFDQPQDYPFTIPARYSPAD